LWRALRPRLAEGPPGADEPTRGGTRPAYFGDPVTGGLLGAGGALALGSVVAYGINGFSTAVGLLWLGALTLLAAAFLRESGRVGRVELWDVLAPIGLALVLAPLYVLRLHAWPVQVSSDEVAIMTAAKQQAAAHGADLFGLSPYFGNPTVLFVVWGALGGLLGGVDLDHMRLLHALVGLLTIGVSYGFFRQLLSRPWALVAAAVFGLNHSFLIISRLAMRENTPVLVEMTALTLLLLGLRKNHPFATFAGGVAAGVGFYVYFPARSVVLVWAVFMLLLAVWYRRQLGGGRIARLAAVAATGVVVTAAPYTIAYAKAPASLTEHQREALLVFEAGRRHQQQWVFASSELAGVAKNIQYGLTAFNQPIEDHAWIYQDRGHGIVDPLTGALIWIGAGFVLLALIRRRGDPWPLLPLSGFVLLWLLLAFVVDEAPAYARMLVTLPLAAFLVAAGVRGVAEFLKRRLARPSWPVVPVVALAALLGIGVWNGFFAWDYIQAGRRTGDDIGGTGRYVAAHRNVSGIRFYVAADAQRWKYYEWGTPGAWNERIRIFASNEAEVGGPIAPDALARFSAARPFAIFMRKDLWTRTKAALRSRYPGSDVRNITPDGRLVVFEIPADASA
jgi:4-amino-4-deoxy-L-arabinose transferase-like glycosyltransferase